MGVSASSLLDEAKSNYVRGEAEAELKAFSLYYRKQFSVARFSQLEDELEQNKQKISQLLKQKGPPEEGEVLYEEGVFYFDDTRKWRERYVVVRANYCLECHDSLQTFIKGVPPRDKLLPTGGTVLTAEEAYMAMVDRCFPDDSSVKEDFAPPLSGMPGQFPVYLRLPYRRDSYFCFRQQAKQATFISFLSDCIRHQNQDFLKKKTCEVQAFLKAIQLYRQDQGKYKAWDMLIGSDVRVMANLVMEKLLPSLEKEMLPRLKAKKTDRKRVWFAIMEDAYIVVQEHLLEGLSALKEDCRTTVRQQEVLIHSEMGQILNTRRQLEEKIRAKVSEDAEKLCSESVQPYLGSVLEEMMEPISSGFMEGRQLSETKMTQACQEVLQGATYEQLKKVLAEMARPNLLSCYQKISSLQDNLKCLQERFSFSNMSGVIHSAQIDLQQLIENAAYTFELLLCKAVEENPENAASATEKAKHRVLKQYNYDSSTVRKRIFQDALVSVTLPFIKKNLAPTCRKELQGLEQMIFSDHSNFIHVENVYENILLDILDKEASKVVSEAASLRKHNLFINNSHSSLSSPPSSPSLVLASPVKTASEALPPSPLVVNGLPPSLQREQRQEKEELQSKATTDASVIETLLGRAKQKEEGAKVCLEAEVPAAKAGETVKEEAGTTEETETNRAKMQETVSVQTEETQTEAEPEIHLKEAEIPLSQTAPTEGESMKSEAPDPRKEPVNPSGEDPQPEDTPQSSEVKLETPSGGEEAAAICIKLKEAAESITASDPNSLDVSVGSDSPHSDLESTGDVSSSSDFLEVAQSPKSSEEMGEDKAAGEEEPTVVQMEGGSSVGDVEASADVKVETPASVDDPTPSPPSETRPPDCIKEIRDLVVEVFEVEQPLHRYPKEE
ncbi:protein Niban 1a [Kryptolebias marmoratus]|uniref:Niban apoptosis regulator 1a n=1 Tax=Kryptolebias marmoratus TaxID=37003 RepID=A0A3Q3AQS8_KRYMA|nr:protein Niban 1a [Kryptolebias marmoratus]